MRPRTATIQVSIEGTASKTWWRVEIGNLGDSTPAVTTKDESLEDALVLAVVGWKEKEGLGD